MSRLPLSYIRMALVLVLALCAACSNDEGSESTDNNMPTPDPDAGMDAGMDTGMDADSMADPELSMCGGFVPRGDAETKEECAACVDANCCEEARTCGEDPDCLALRECFAACALGDAACTQACSDSASEETLEINSPMITCRNTECEQECITAVDWSCLGNPEPAPATEPGEMDFAVTLVDFQTGTEVSGAEVKMCAQGDDLCETPLGTETTDAEGKATFTVDRGTSGFNGYMEVTGAGRFPSRIYLRQPLQESTELSFSAISQASMGAFVGLLGLELDPELSLASVLLLDCSGRRARGAVFSSPEAQEGTTVGYLSNGLPSPDATATDSSGIGGLFNLPVGEATIRGERQDTGGVIFEQRVFLKAGFIATLSQDPNR